MANGVGCRIHAVRHDGTVTEHMVSLPIVGRVDAGLIIACMGITYSDIAEENDGRDRVVSVVHPNAVVNTSGRVGQRGRLAKDVGSTYTEVIIFIPVGVGARSDVGISSLVLCTNHGLTETHGVVTEVARQAAVTHSKEILVGIGQLVHVGVGELGIIPHVVVAVGGIVDKTDTRAQCIVAARILTLIHMGMHFGKAVGGIIIIGSGIVDSGGTDTCGPIRVPTSNEGHIVEVARVGHGVLLILQNLVDDGSKLVGVFS